MHITKEQRLENYQHSKEHIVCLSDDERTYEQNFRRRREQQAKKWQEFIGKMTPQERDQFYKQQKRKEKISLWSDRIYLFFIMLIFPAGLVGLALGLLGGPVVGVLTTIILSACLALSAS